MKKNLIIIFLVCSLNGYSQKETDYLCVCHFWGNEVGSKESPQTILLEPFFITSERREYYLNNKIKNDIIGPIEKIVKKTFEEEFGFENVGNGFTPINDGLLNTVCSTFLISQKKEAYEHIEKYLMKGAIYTIKWQPPQVITGIPATKKSPIITRVEKEKPKEKEKPVVRETPPKYDITLSKTSYHEDAKKAEERAQLRMLQAEAELEVKKMAARAQGMLNDLKLEQMLAKLRNQPKMKTNRQ